MKIEKLVSIPDQAVEVSVTSEEITAALLEEPDAKRPFTITQGINNCAQFLNALTDEMIASLNDPQRKVIAAFLTTQAARFTK